MGNKLYVGGLSWNTDDSGLKAAFEQYGEVTEAKVITDRESGRSRGFGFVTFTEEASASAAMAAPAASPSPPAPTVATLPAAAAPGAG